jgi:DNA-binding transcriptional MerR regulator
MRISELAEQVGVPVSTVRFYERIGLLDAPLRSASGYRQYDDASASRLLFIARARTLGLSCDQITDLLPAWGGADCTAAHERVLGLIEEKRREIAARVRELRAFAAQLDDVRAELEASPPPAACRTDLTCCVPSASGELLTIERRPAADP